MERRNGKPEVIFDVDDFMDRVEDDEELACELVEIFLEDAPEKLEMINQGVSNGDAETVEKAAHSLKGAAGNLSAKVVRELALKLETMGKGGTLDGAAELVAQVEGEYEKVRVALEAARTDL